MLILSNIARLYDGRSAESSSIHREVDLYVEGERIHELCAHGQGPPAGEGDTLVDASQLTVTPGLIDCHGHVTVVGVNASDLERMSSAAWLLYVEKILHRTLVDGGVTTMRDVGGATQLVKRLVDEGTILGPRLKIAICMLSTTGGHADFRGPDRCHDELSKLWPEAPGRPSSIVDGPWECRKRVREVVACGADLVKLCTSPGVASPSDELENRDFTAAEIEAICDEAQARGKRVAAHAHSRSGIQLAIRHGVHDIQHISFMQKPEVEEAYERGCVVTPTSWIMSALLEAEDIDPYVLDKAKRVQEVHAAAVEHAVSGGLPLLMGTDPVLPGMHGRNYMELVHLIRDGVPPLSAWYGATGLAAREIGQEDAGELAAGKRADLLVASGDVIQDPELFERGALLEVLKDGFGHRAALDGVPQRDFRSTIAASLPPAPVAES